MAEQKPQSKSVLETFREDFLHCWRKLPDKLLFFALLLIWCALFHLRGNAMFGWVDTPSLFGWMHWAYTTWPDDGHCMLIPWVVLALLWWKREELLNLPKEIWWPALSFVVMGLLLHLVGYMIQQSRVSILGFFIGLYGLTGLVWGKHWLRATVFPIILFVFCVPMGTMSDAITVPLRMLVTKLSVAFSNNLLGIRVFHDGSRIFGEGGFQYDVAPACSGIRSLIALLAMTTIYGFVTFRPAWKRILMVIVALPLAVMGNIVRITGVIVTGDAFGQNAGALVEQKLGFVTFAVAIACVLLFGHFLRDQEAERHAVAS